MRLAMANRASVANAVAIQRVSKGIQGLTVIEPISPFLPCGPERGPAKGHIEAIRLDPGWSNQWLYLGIDGGQADPGRRI